MFRDLLQRILYSPVKHERHAWPLGMYVYGNSPVLVPEELHNCHGALHGSTQSGKSLLLRQILSTVIQSQHPARREWLQEIGDNTKPSSLFIIDNKGDNAMFWEACLTAQACQMPFRFFSLVPELATNLWMPLKQRAYLGMSSTTQGQELARGLGHFHGHGYGMEHWNGIVRYVLTHVLSKKKDLDTFAKLWRFIESAESYQDIDGHLNDWRKADGLRVALQPLAGVDALNRLPEDFKDRPDVLKDAIDIGDLFVDSPKVFYFYLPTTQGAARGAGILALALLKASAADPLLYKDNRVVAIVDEAHHNIGHELADTLTQMQSRGVSMVLSFHYEDQLVIRNLDLIEGLRTNTGWEVITSLANDSTMERLLKIFPRGQFFTKTFVDGDTDNAEPFMLAEKSAPLFNENDLLRLAGHGAGVVWLKKMIGTVTTPYPMPFKWSPHIDLETFQMWSSSPPPRLGNGLFQIAKEFTPPAVDPLAALKGRGRGKP